MKKILILLAALSTLIIACNNTEKTNNAVTAGETKETVTENKSAATKAPSENELSKLAGTYTLKPQHEGFSCADCHGENNSLDKYYLIESDTCLTCHSSREEVAELTKEYDAKGGINPHNSFHLDTRAECYMCHREHKPSINYCSKCHDTDVWMKPVP